MISRRTKWLVGGFTFGLIAFAILQVLSFRLLREMQAVVSAGGQLSPADLQHSKLLNYGPPLAVCFYVGCLFAALALISLILDNRSRQ
jgi:hypothetical protein